MSWSGLCIVLTMVGPAAAVDADAAAMIERGARIAGCPGPCRAARSPGGRPRGCGSAIGFRAVGAP